VAEEITNCLDFLKEVYDVFGFEFAIRLSTQPDKSVGDHDTWRRSEEALAQALQANDIAYTIDKGGGAFYGPKVDVAIRDCFGREHQCATIQLDFNLPSRFELKYTDHQQQSAVPVLIHRAMLGSVERMMAILTEHTSGDWPLWLSPRQVMVCLVAEAHTHYGLTVQRALEEQDLYVDLSRGDASVSKQVLLAQRQRYNYIIILGEQEASKQTVSFRTRKGAKESDIPLTEFIDRLVQEVANKTR